jgi:hypothetical protein
MPATASTTDSPAALFPRRNLILFAAALVTVIAGYAVLQSGPASAEAASVLLVVGYCVLLPLSLIL